MEKYDARPYKCPTCKMCFKNKQFLNRHFVVHTNSRDYVCQACNKTYKYKKGLNRHISKEHEII